MRETLFRGKRTDNGEWVEGHNYMQTQKGGCVSLVETGLPIQMFGDGSAFVIMMHPYMEVDPSTVGQFTGLTDKNGKRIFEGDVIRYNTFDDFDCHSVVKFGEYEQDGSAGEYKPKSCIGWYCEVDNFTAPDWTEEDPVFFFNNCLNYLKQQNLLEVNDECEIIGNIHDNPELLEVDNG